MAIFDSIWDDLKYSLRAGNMVTKLAVINFAVFVTAQLAHLFVWVAIGFDSDTTLQAYELGLRWFCIPSDLSTLLWRPWTLVTHMFLHDVLLWHLFNNLTGLYIFGNIVGDLVGDRRVLPIYLLGGLAGGAVFAVSAQFAPDVIGDYALGASAAVMALGGAALILAPDYRVRLLLLGEVKVKYIVLVLVLLDIVAISYKYNSGGPVAHIAGFALGCLFMYRLRDGHDWSDWVNVFLDKIVGLFSAQKRSKQTTTKRPKQTSSVAKTGAGTSQGNPASDREDRSMQERLDEILSKIKASGYDSLTPEEKEFLYETSRKL